jgi:flagellar hook-associated protein 2
VAADLATLGALGLSLTKDGTLQVDAARFNAASGARAGELSAALGQRMDALADYVEELTRPLTGVIGQRTQALDLQSARMSARVTDIDARLDKKRTQMLAQYAKFEASLGRLNAIGTSMSAQFAGLTRSNGDR